MVYYVDLFYKFFIPGVLGGMGILVLMDFSRMGFNRLLKRSPVNEKRHSETVESNTPTDTETASENEIHD